ncbi:MAG: hypothetical protein DBX49_01220 [Clostridia bacterium]|nr:MAG: hypothetical protein DBX49_01220 [Clostridia bacterium]
MRESEKNKLWGFPFTPENLKTARAYPHFYACGDHCLIISPTRPEGAQEIGESLYPWLTVEDWNWIFRESDCIRQEQEAAYHGELLAAQEEFLRKFEENLKAARKAEMRGDGEN